MNLSASGLNVIAKQVQVQLPDAAILTLPEKVVQFGTGVLLRGLPDYFIDKANQQGLFNGRIVVVKSTAQNKTSGFDRQDNLYTICIRGIEQGQQVNQYRINSAISRVLSAREQWQDVLACADDKEIQIIISNTTEVGIVLKEDDIVTGEQAPESFPGKLLAFLYRRYQTFAGVTEAGMVILPTELIPDNGSKLKSICTTLAHNNRLEPAFIQWLTEANDFCDTLVDRIVPGALSARDTREAESFLGYRDELMIMSEVYRLWAIETSSERSKAILSFAPADDGIVVTGNIKKFRDLKLRLLNGAHSFSCGLALLSGFETVKEAMDNSFFEQYISSLMTDEIVPTLVGDTIGQEEAIRFSESVLDRFRNPYIEHRWESISMNYTAKMMMRNIPTLLSWYALYHKVPPQMTLGFAAYIYFMRSDKTADGKFSHNGFGKQINIDDPFAAALYTHWQKSSCEEALHQILSDVTLWETDLTALPGFEAAVMDNIRKLRTQTKMTQNKATA